MVYRGQVGAARPGAARVRAVMSSGWDDAVVVDGGSDGVPGEWQRLTMAACGGVAVGWGKC